MFKYDICHFTVDKRVSIFVTQSKSKQELKLNVLTLLLKRTKIVYSGKIILVEEMTNRIFFRFERNTSSSSLKIIKDLVTQKKHIDMCFLNGDLTAREYIDQSMPIRNKLRKLTSSYQATTWETLSKAV